MLRACAAILVSCAGVAAAIAACSGDSTTTTLASVNGVLIRSESLVAGHGCGVGDTQVLKYVAVVSYDRASLPQDASDGDLALFASTFDCFTDGVFPNLLPASNGSLSFDVAIYAFNASSYNANASTIATAVAAANASPYPNPDATLNGIATWTTTCTAAQQANIQVLASCNPLTPVSHPPADAGGDGASDAGADADAAQTALQIPTDKFPLADGGGTLFCGVDYTSASALYRDDRDAATSNGIAGPAPCQSGLTIHALPAVSYAIDVQLLAPSDGGARSIAVSHCTATAKAGETVVPTCLPAQSP